MPGFTIYTSNRLEKLAQILAATMQQEPLPPLHKEIIVVQSKGMEHWLSLEIAAHNKICANIEFPFPKAFIYAMFQKVMELPEQSPFAPEIMTWTLMDILPALLDQPLFEPLRNYVRGENPELRMFQLSERIARVFDQYMVFRPDVFAAWEQGRTDQPADFKHAGWQAELWRQIRERQPDKAVLPHPAALAREFINKIGAGVPQNGLPRRVAVFGISTLPPLYIEILDALAAKIEVNFFYLNPCREYWEYAYSEKEIVRFIREGFSDEDQYCDKGNSLLASMGTAGREFFSLILSRVGTIGREFFEDPGHSSLLTGIQSDILHLVDGQAHQEGRAPVSRDDRSVQIHACHSPLREVEVLYDNLLSLFEEKQDLVPKDIVVMTPDIAQYAPFVQAVFDTPENESKRIPYSIADQSLCSSNTVAEVLLAVLALDQQRFRAVDVLDILENPAVHRRLHLAEQDLEDIRLWVNQAGIRWGIDGQYRTALGLPGFNENTWQFGLERMLLGYALQTEDDTRVFSGILPCGEIDGDRARVLGIFAEFIARLFQWAVSLQNKRSLAAWSADLGQLLTDLFSNDEDTGADIQAIRDILSEKGIARIAESAGFAEAVSPEVIRSYLKARLEGEKRTHGFISSGVTFCTMLPMRSIPFRVVYLLGMNDGDFPRSEQKCGFDMMESRKRMGDRSKRHEDRYLFLETVLSARENLLISYVGQNIKDNSLIPPSGLVSELGDYIEQAFTCEGPGTLREHILVKHPLQPFSRAYFYGEGGLFSFSEHNFRAAGVLHTASRRTTALLDQPLPPADAFRSIHLDQLCQFFTNPPEFLIKNRLQATLKLPENARLEEREPFDLNGLQQYHLLQQLVDHCLKGQDLEAYYSVVRASGTLPHGSTGAAEYQRCKSLAVPFADLLQQYGAGQPRLPGDTTVAVTVSNTTIQATLQDLYQPGQLFYRYAALKARDRLRAWLYHLALNVLEDAPCPQQTVLIAQDARVMFRHMQPHQAREFLEQLTEIFRRGLFVPVCFFAETSQAYADRAEHDEEAALKAARQKWCAQSVGPYTRPGEGDDPYVRACFGSSMPATPEFKEIALTVFKPLFSFSSVHKR